MKMNAEKSSNNVRDEHQGLISILAMSDSVKLFLMMDVLQNEFTCMADVSEKENCSTSLCEVSLDGIGLIVCELRTSIIICLP